MSEALLMALLLDGSFTQLETEVMAFYAHTAEDDAGNPLPESSGKWQLLSDHLRNVARQEASPSRQFNITTIVTSSICLKPSALDLLSEP